MKESTSSKLKVAAVLIPLIGIAVTVYFNLPAEREVEWSISGYWKYTSPLPSQKLQLSLEGEAIDSIDVLRLQMKNTGDEPIQPSDFGGPIYVDFEDGTKIYNVYKCTTSYADCEINIDTFRDGIVTLTPTLLNPGDYFNVQFIVSPISKGPNIDQRISGIGDRVSISLHSRMRFRTPDGKHVFIGVWSLWIAAIFSLIVHFIGAYISIAQMNLESSQWWMWILVLTFLIFSGYVAWLVQSIALLSNPSPFRSENQFWTWISMILGYAVLISLKDVQENLKSTVLSAYAAIGSFFVNRSFLDQ